MDNGLVSINQSRLAIAATIASFLCVAGTARAQVSGLEDSAWPRFGGGNSNNFRGVASGATPALKWVLGGIGVYNQPALSNGGTLYAGGGTYLYAIDSVSGNLLWKANLAQTPLTSPAIGRDGTVYIGTATGQLFAVNGSTGQVKWSVSAHGPIESSPAIDPHGLIVFGCDDHNVYAVQDNSSSGQIVWTYRTAGPVLSSPAITSDSTHGIVYYIGSNDGNLYALVNGGDHADVAWAYNPGAGQVTGSPCVDSSGTIYCTTSQARFEFALNYGALFAVGPNGELRWISRYNLELPSTELALVNGSLYMSAISYNILSSAITTSSSINCLSTADGSTKWSVKDSYHPLTSPIAAADGTIYVVDGIYGDVKAINGQTGTLLWDGSTSGGPGSGAPAIGYDGSLYVPGNGALYAFGRTDVAGLKTTTASVVGGDNIEAEVTLTASAPSRGLNVGLQSSSPNASPSPSVWVPAGQSYYYFAVPTHVSAGENVTLTANFGSTSKQTTFTISPTPIKSFKTTASSVSGGKSIYGEIVFPGTAGPNGAVVSLSCPSGNVSIPATVTVPSGSIYAYFPIQTSEPATSTQATITATFGGSSKQVTFTITP